MTDSVGDYLQATLAEASFDSHGRFTLALGQLLRKLACHSLFHWSNWSLFAIRAMLRSGCRSIHLTQKKQQIWLVGHASHELPTLEGVQDQSPDQILAGDSAPALLARALGSLMRPETEQICLARFLDGACLDVQYLYGGAEPPELSPNVQRGGWTLGIYLRLAPGCGGKLESHLAYGVQFCPVPVVAHSSGWWTFTTDLRACHWLEEQPGSPAYPDDLQARVTLPLACDIYRTGSEAVLLKPCGGRSQAVWAAWTEGGPFEWTRPAGALASLSAVGRYFWGEPGPARQELEWSARRTYMNSEWGDKGESTARLTTCGGRDMLFVSRAEHEDTVIPILDGVTLGALKGKLGIAGVTLVTAAPAHLKLDLTGLRLVEDEALQAWLQQLRGEIKVILDEVTEVPPHPPVVMNQPSMAKTMLATGSICLLAGTITCGLQPQDIFFFTHGGVFGGSAVSVGMRLLRDFLPHGWREQEQSQLVALLKQRRQAALKAWRDGAEAGGQGAS